MNPAPAGPLASLLVASIVLTASAQVPRSATAAGPRVVHEPDGVSAHRDLAYVEGGHERQVLDLFVPEKGDGPFPLLIWVHGGGWQNGSKDGCPPLRNGYASRGYAVASLNYRLSGHAVFPAQIEDCKAAIRWLRAHAAKYRLDPERFGVWGSSAGGHLVALLGTSGGVKEFDAGPNPGVSSRVQAVCDYYGPTDFEVFVSTPGYERHAADESPEAKLLGGAVKDNPQKARRANPITYVTPDDPPFLIVHGDKDGTVPINQSQLLFEALKKAGADVHFHTIRGAGHGQGFGGPEIEPMVAAFFERHLRPTAAATTRRSAPEWQVEPPSHASSGGPERSPPAVPDKATTSESEASTFPADRAQVARLQPAEAAQERGRIPSFDFILQRGDENRDGRLSREEFRGPPALFDRLDRNRDGVVTREEHEGAFPSRPDGPGGRRPAGADAPAGGASSPAVPPASTAASGGGLLFFASYRHQDDPAAAANPHIAGALFTIYWSDVEKREGVFDWSAIDRRIAPWIAAGKKVALRIMWSSSGTWPDPAAAHPTPQFVIDAGAVTVRSESSRTDIPLVWDPVYVRHANRFLREVARKFDGDPNVLFVDVTPGAETNPYRFRRINAAEPEFKRIFAQKAASDGRRYSDELWLETVNKAVDDAAAAFSKTPLLVTLNTGSLDGPSQMQAIGDHCVARGCLVGQNGLTGRSYAETGSRGSAFAGWGGKTKLYFEMLDASGGGTGSLLDVMKAAERIGCDFLGVYAVDVLRGTRGQEGFDPEVEAALAYGARSIGGSLPTAGAPVPPPAPSPRSSPVPGFRIDGERWTWGTGVEEVSGILVKPEGKGPFPAILISHGLGGSAESFGLKHAREFVKMGFVCIAPDYTHNARAAQAMREGRGHADGPPATGAGAGVPPGRSRPYGDFGASDENLRRARLCIDALRAMPEVDPKRIAAFGHSMGGFVTIGLAASATNLLAAAAITGSGIAPQEGYAAPSAAATQRIRTPFLMIHGANDTTVRPAQSESLKAILDRNGVPNERRVFPGEAHNLDRTVQAEVYGAIRAWFARNGVLPL